MPTAVQEPRARREDSRVSRWPYISEAAWPSAANRLVRPETIRSKRHRRRKDPPIRRFRVLQTRLYPIDQESPYSNALQSIEYSIHPQRGHILAGDDVLRDVCPGRYPVPNGESLPLARRS